MGKVGIYVPMAKLMDHLRRAYKPGAEVDFDAFWDNIVKSQVLCLDEIEKYNATSWAEERFFALLDARYRDMTSCVTVLATNDIESVPGYLKSRMMDGRFKVMFLDGKDMRGGLRR